MKKSKLMLAALATTVFASTGALVACGDEALEEAAKGLLGSNIKVTLDANGGTFAGGAETKVITADTLGRIKVDGIANPTRDGYVFNGYSYSATGGGVNLDSSAIGGNKFDAVATLYAQWVEQAAGVYTIKFDANGGTFAPVVASRTKVTSAGKLDALIPDNYVGAPSGKTFVGWFTSATGGEQVTLETVFSSNATIYAQWSGGSVIEQPPIEEDVEYTITFNAGNGTCETPSAATVDKKLATLPQVTPPEKHTFVGWFTTETGGTQITAEYAFNGDATIYAHYAAEQGPVENKHAVVIGDRRVDMEKYVKDPENAEDKDTRAYEYRLASVELAEGDIISFDIVGDANVTTNAVEFFVVEKECNGVEAATTSTKVSTVKALKTATYSISLKWYNADENGGNCFVLVISDGSKDGVTVPKPPAPPAVEQEFEFYLCGTIGGESKWTAEKGYKFTAMEQPDSGVCKQFKVEVDLAVGDLFKVYATKKPDNKGNWDYNNYENLSDTKNDYYTSEKDENNQTNYKALKAGKFTLYLKLYDNNPADGTVDGDCIYVACVPTGATDPTDPPVVPDPTDPPTVTHTATATIGSEQVSMIDNTANINRTENPNRKYEYMLLDKVFTVETELQFKVDDEIVDIWVECDAGITITVGAKTATGTGSEHGAQGNKIKVRQSKYNFYLQCHTVDGKDSWRLYVAAAAQNPTLNVANGSAAIEMVDNTEHKAADETAKYEYVLASETKKINLNAGDQIAIKVNNQAVTNLVMKDGSHGITIKDNIVTVKAEGEYTFAVRYYEATGSKAACWVVEMTDGIAETLEKDAYYVVGLGKNWSPLAANKVDATAGVVLTLEAGDEFKIAKWDGSKLDWDVKSYARADISVGAGYVDGAAEAIKVKVAGTYTVKIAENKIRITSDDVAMPELYEFCLYGKIGGTQYNETTAQKFVKMDTPDNGVWMQYKLQIDLAVGDTFKIFAIKKPESKDAWSYNSYKNIENGEIYAAKGNDYEIKKAGKFTFYIKLYNGDPTDGVDDSNEIWVGYAEFTPTLNVTNGSTAIEMVDNTEHKAADETAKYEYVLASETKKINLNAGDQIAIKVNNQAVTNLVMKDGSHGITIKGNIVTVKAAGEYTFAVRYYEAKQSDPACWSVEMTDGVAETLEKDAYYVVGLGKSWSPLAANKVDATAGIVLTLEAGDEFKIAKWDGGKLDWEAKSYARADISVGAGYVDGAAEAIKVKVAGTYTVKIAENKVQITSDDVDEYEFYLYGTIGGDSKWAVEKGYKFTKVETPDSGVWKQYAVEVDLAVGDTFRIMSIRNALNKDGWNYNHYDNIAQNANYEASGNDFKVKKAGKFTFKLKIYDNNPTDGVEDGDAVTVDVLTTETPEPPTDPETPVDPPAVLTAAMVKNSQDVAMTDNTANIDKKANPNRKYEYMLLNQAFDAETELQFKAGSDVTEVWVECQTGLTIKVGDKNATGTGDFGAKGSTIKIPQGKYNIYLQCHTNDNVDSWRLWVEKVRVYNVVVGGVSTQLTKQTNAKPDATDKWAYELKSENNIALAVGDVVTFALQDSIDNPVGVDFFVGAASRGVGATATGSKVLYVKALNAAQYSVSLKWYDADGNDGNCFVLTISDGSETEVEIGDPVTIAKVGEQDVAMTKNDKNTGTAVKCEYMLLKQEYAAKTVLSFKADGFVVSPKVKCAAGISIKVGDKTVTNTSNADTVGSTIEVDAGSYNFYLKCGTDNVWSLWVEKVAVPANVASAPKALGVNGFYVVGEFKDSAFVWNDGYQMERSDDNGQEQYVVLLELKAGNDIKVRYGTCTNDSCVNLQDVKADVAAVVTRSDNSQAIEVKKDGKYKVYYKPNGNSIYIEFVG